jgi:hypothetical protein
MLLITQVGQLLTLQSSTPPILYKYSHLSSRNLEQLIDDSLKRPPFPLRPIVLVTIMP